MNTAELMALSDDELVAARDRLEDDADARRDEAAGMLAKINALGAERIAMPTLMAAALGDAKQMRALRDRADEAPYQEHALMIQYRRTQIAGLVSRNDQLKVEEEQQRRIIADLNERVRVVTEERDRFHADDYRGHMSDVRALKRAAEDTLAGLESRMPESWLTRRMPTRAEFAGERSE